MSKAYSHTGVGHNRRDGEHVRGCTSWGGREDPPVTAQAGAEAGRGINHLHMVVVSIFEKRMFIFASISKSLSN